MPRRRGTRLTTGPKKRGVGKKIGGDPTAPTELEWASMVQFGSFVVRDEDDDEHTFKTNDLATILPHGIDPGTKIDVCDYWVGKIKEIRASGPDNVWTRVQWYWSGDDVKSAVKSFKPEACGRYERVFSDHYDYVSTSSYDAVVPLVRFNENDVGQPYIGHQTFFQRYTFEFKARIIQPKQGFGTCTCSEPYNPNDPSTSELMHYCPRPSCRRWYHIRCLLERQQNKTPPAPRDDVPAGKKRTRTQMEKDGTVASQSEDLLSREERALQLLTCSPDLDGAIDFVALVGGSLPNFNEEMEREESEADAEGEEEEEEEEEEDEEEESSSARQVELAILGEDFPSSRSVITVSTSRANKKALEADNSNEQLADTWVKRLRSQKEGTQAQKAQPPPPKSRTKATAKRGRSTRSAKGSVVIVAPHRGKKSAAPAPLPRRTTRATASVPAVEATDSASAAPVTRRRTIVPVGPTNPLITPPPDDVARQQRKAASKKAKGKQPQRSPQITPEDVIEYYSRPGSEWDNDVDTAPLLSQALLKIARQPILRGLGYPEGGVSGNVSVVVKARRRVYQLLRWVGRRRGADAEDDDLMEGEQPCPMAEEEKEDWERYLVDWGMDSDLEATLFEKEEREKVPKKRKKQGKEREAAEESKRRAFRCPGCSGAI